jgi:regulator of protease activity HflC (stomatin/prohibitin superfamily)
MAFLDSVPEIVAGVSVDGILLGICLGLIYRFFSGKFLIPAKHFVLPNQNGVIVQGEQVLRVAQPGRCWVRPKQRIILCDMRPRHLQMVAVELICKDNGIVRLSLSAEYCIADAANYYSGSTNAGDAIFVALRRCIFTVSRQQQSATIVSVPEAFGAIVRDVFAPETSKLGLKITSLNIWEALHVGWFYQPEATATELDNPLPGPLVH